MPVNKVIYGNKTLVDLTDSTVTSDSLLSGASAYDASGTKITGTLGKISVDDALSNASTNPVQNKVIKAALDGKVNRSDLVQLDVNYVDGVAVFSKIESTTWGLEISVDDTTLVFTRTNLG